MFVLLVIQVQLKANSSSKCLPEVVEKAVSVCSHATKITVSVVPVFVFETRSVYSICHCAQPRTFVVVL